MGRALGGGDSVQRMQQHFLHEGLQQGACRGRLHVPKDGGGARSGRQDEIEVNRGVHGTVLQGESTVAGAQDMKTIDIV